MPLPNQTFYLKIASVEIGQSANITGTLVAVPSGTATTLTTWTEIYNGFYTHALSLAAGEYMATVTVPWNSNLYALSILVNSSSVSVSHGTIIS